MIIIERLSDMNKNFCQRWHTVTVTDGHGHGETPSQIQVGLEEDSRGRDELESGPLEANPLDLES
jgi:hypothetical protein